MMASLLLVAGLTALCAFLLLRRWPGALGVSRLAYVPIDTHLSALQALAQAIDAKGQSDADHVRRMQHYAGGLAEALGMSPGDVLDVRMAAMLHDIGTLAVPDDILAKPGGLTPDESLRVQGHARIGADLLSLPSYPSAVGPIVLSHHERWDGGGYPRGLKGTGIPLGARVLAVVDCFDVSTSDRPYHQAMQAEAAVRLLKQESGHALDPSVVDAFVRVLPTLRGTLGAGVRPVVLESGAALDQIARSQREQRVLAEIARARGMADGAALMAFVSTKLATLVPFSACAYFGVTGDADMLACRFATGTDEAVLREIRIRLGDGATGWVALNRRARIDTEPLADFQVTGTGSMTSMRSAVVCPLLSGGRLIGTLGVYHTTPRFYGEDDRRILNRVSEEVAATLYHSLDFEQARSDALTDPLTGLPNKRFLIAHLTKELARAQRLNSEVGLIVLDIDTFKAINDRQGHQAGDQALQMVANVLRLGVRPYDSCVRYAGDEFVVVLSDCGRGEAERKVVELQEAVAQVCLVRAPGPPVALGISAGTAVFPHDGRTYEALLACADRRMYDDKARRRLATPGRVERHRGA